jgi:hypothetical protein
VVVLGEGTFHQIHGGVMTNANPQDKRTRRELFEQEYRSIRGEPFERLRPDAFYLGAIPRQALDGLAYSADYAKPKRKSGPEAAQGDRT